MSAAPSYAARRATYAAQWAGMVIEVPKTVDKAARSLLAAKARYQAVAARVGVPWFWVACIHWRESSGDFRGVLHNGQRVIGTGKKTTIVPKGRGPFASWEEAAIDAMTIAPHDMRKVEIDCLERFAYEAEKWNGWGYYYHGVPSAYLWSMSSAYKGGKYVADGKWSSTALDAQVGVMPILKRMMELDPSIGFGEAAEKPAEPDAPLPGSDVPATQPAGPAARRTGLVAAILLLAAGALAGLWHQIVAFLDFLWPFN